MLASDPSLYTVSVILKIIASSVHVFNPTLMRHQLFSSVVI